jgi:hypothetical protein
LGEVQESLDLPPLIILALFSPPRQWYEQIYAKKVNDAEKWFGAVPFSLRGNSRQKKVCWEIAQTVGVGFRTL